MRTIDFPKESFIYEKHQNLIKVTHRDRTSGAVLNQLCVSQAVASKHFAEKLAAHPYSKK